MKRIMKKMILACLCILLCTLSVSAQKLTITINVPAAGKYAVAIFQDKNGNGKLDSNFLGIPNEPFGFSNIKSYPMGTPKFKNTAIDIDKDLKLIIPLFDSPF